MAEVVLGREKKESARALKPRPCPTAETEGRRNRGMEHQLEEGGKSFPPGSENRDWRGELYESTNADKMSREERSERLLWRDGFCRRRKKEDLSHSERGLAMGGV